MKRFVHHNPISRAGAPAVRSGGARGERLLGGNGYLPNAEYRRLRRRSAGSRATPSRRALRRVGPPRGRRHAGRRAGAAASKPPRSGGRSCSSASRRSSRCCSPGRSAPAGRCRSCRPTCPPRPASGCSIARPGSRRSRSGRRRRLRARPLGGVPARDLARRRSGQCRRAAGGARPGRPTGRRTAAGSHGRRLARGARRGAVRRAGQRASDQVGRGVRRRGDGGLGDAWTRATGCIGRGARWRRATCPAGSSASVTSPPRFAPCPNAPRRPSRLLLQRLGVPDDALEGVPVPAPRAVAGLGRPDPLAGRRTPPIPGRLGHPIDAAQYLAIRLFYEAELADAVCRRAWQIPATVPAIAAYWQARGRRGRGTSAPALPRRTRTTPTHASHANAPGRCSAWRSSWSCCRATCAR